MHRETADASPGLGYSMCGASHLGGAGRDALPRPCALGGDDLGGEAIRGPLTPPKPETVNMHTCIDIVCVYVYVYMYVYIYIYIYMCVCVSVAIYALICWLNCRCLFVSIARECARVCVCVCVWVDGYLHPRHSYT